MLKDCNDCKFINITEEEQRGYKWNKVDHICLRYNKRVLHLSEPFKLTPCKECNEGGIDTIDEIHNIIPEEE